MTVIEQAQRAQRHADGRHTATREASAEPTVGELVTALSEQLARLGRNELRLAELEAKRRGKRAGASLGAAGFGGFLAFLGACCFVAAAVLAASTVMRPWAAALVIGAFAFIISGLVGTPGLWGLVRARRGAGAESAASIKADVRAISQAVHR